VVARPLPISEPSFDHAKERVSAPRSVADVLHSIRDRTPTRGQTWAAAVATGFDLLDRVLEGGLRASDMFMLGGSPGVGKTIAALQMARNVARSGRLAVFVSYEHDAATMLGRLLALELGDLSRPDIAPELDRLRTVVVEATAGFRSLDEAIAIEPLLAEVDRRVDDYADRLWFVRGSGAATDLDTIEATLPADADDEVVLFVDYLQKVAVHPEPADEVEKVTRIAEGLKDLALRRRIAVVALVAADIDGLRAERLRLHHLRGSSALAYECDVAVLMNDKHRAVSREHLTYDPVRAASFHHQVVFSIEKNRGGPAMVDLEFRKDFSHYRFDPVGNYLTERLVDDRLAQG
jgi:replicative DNA helicase